MRNKLPPEDPLLKLDEFAVRGTIGKLTNDDIDGILYGVVSDELRIRPFRPEDAATVNRIAVAAWDQYREVFTDWPHAGPNFAATAELAKDVDLLLAEDTAIRGFVGYAGPGRPRERIFKRNWAIIRMLSVDPPARGRGIGRQLTEECITRARRDAAPIIALHTSVVMQAALAIYTKLGFQHHRNIVDRHGIPYAMYLLPLAAT